MRGAGACALGLSPTWTRRAPACVPQIEVTAEMVQEKLEPMTKKADLTRFIL